VGNAGSRSNGLLRQSGGAEPMSVTFRHPSADPERQRGT